MDLLCSLIASRFVLNYDSLGTIATIWKYDSLRDHLWSSLFLLLFLLILSSWVFFFRFLVDWKRSNIPFNRSEGLYNLILILSILTNDPEGHSDDQVRSDLGERLADIGEDRASVLWVDLNDLSDEKDSLQGGEGRLAFEFEERFHERAQNKWDGLRERLRNLIDRFD